MLSLSILATWRWRRRYARALQSFALNCRTERIVRDAAEAAAKAAAPAVLMRKGNPE